MSHLKLTIFGIFNALLFTQYVNVARYACNVECDFFSVIFKHCVKSGPMIISMVVLLVSLMRRFFDPSNHSLCAQMKMIAAIIIVPS